MDAVDSILLSQDAPHYTELRPMLWGTFNLSQAAIPYYQSVMSLEEVATELRLVENLPSDLRAKWRLEELFQREIDWERVRNEIFNGYLRRPEKLKFFNSLTVALLPLNDSKMLAREYGDTPVEPELRDALKRPPFSVANIGGVQVIKSDSSAHGYIRWNPKRIFPATIDGQHRLASLQMLFNEGNLPKAATETKVSVIFLIIDPRVGFDIGKLQLAEDENPILTVVREVFIDLNKHAEEVVRSRRILLDDQEIESRCLRSLLASRVGEEEAGKLPLGLVHWQHNVTAKFNTGKPTATFVTTVELLHSIISDLLGIERPRDPLDEKQVRKFVASIENALSITDRIQENPARYPDLKPLGAYVEKMYLAEGFEVPFVNLPSPYLRACVDGFAEKWTPLIVGVLTRLRIYREFIEKVRLRGGIDGDLAFYLVQPKKAQEQQLREWGEERFAIIDKPQEELASLKNADWPFYAVFQKALFRATAIAARHFGVVRGGVEGDIQGFLSQWIAFLDELGERGLFEVKKSLSSNAADLLWSGISLNPASATVRWSDSAVQRICAILVLWWYVHTSGMRQMGRFLKAIAKKRANERFPLASSLAEDVRKGLRQVVCLTDEELADDEESRRVENRLRLLLVVAKNEEIEEFVDEEAEAGSEHSDDDGDVKTANDGTE